MLLKRVKQFGVLLIAYVIIVIAFFFIGGDQIKYSEIVSNLQPKEGTFPELVEGNILEQSFWSSSDTLDSVAFVAATYGRDNKGILKLSLIDKNINEIVDYTEVSVDELRDNELYVWNFDKGVEHAKNKEYMLKIESTCLSNEAPTIYYTNIEKGNTGVIYNGEKKDLELAFQFSGKKYNYFGTHYWNIMSVILGLICIYMLYELFQEKRGKCTVLILLEEIWKKYEFLIKQLVVRDFKTKYKRSVLGYLWSFLNPLLTMLVQYVVFSNLFKQDIKNFPVYLLVGTILFSFFQEAVGQGLNSILVNASLITKVYMPKYIYPVTKVISSSINLLISILPLIIVTLLTGTKITFAILLLPFVLICLILFCVGLSLMLSSAMVFFRDTQYLWGIATLIWMYATPLFYPENIIPEKYQIIQKINPLYHMIKFTRIVLIDGVSPEPRRYVYCLVSAIVACVIGTVVFKKTQDKFVLYI